MKKLLSFIISEITNGEDFSIAEEGTPPGFVKLTVETVPENMGLIIGKNGRIIKAIRSILRAKATLDKVGFNLEVVEKEVQPKS